MMANFAAELARLYYPLVLKSTLMQIEPIQWKRGLLSRSAQERHTGPRHPGQQQIKSGLVSCWQGCPSMRAPQACAYRCRVCRALPVRWAGRPRDRASFAYCSSNAGLSRS
eukprot:452067-Pyramimonas_sp.AAC.1